MAIKKIGILTSGGDAPGMNAAIRAAVRTAIYHGLKVVGVMYGYKGLMEGNFIDMSSRRSVSEIVHRGGTILKTARAPEFKTEEGVRKALEKIKEEGIEALVVIGGDGSLRGANELNNRGVPTVLIPATIDNDIAGTEYCIGFDTAANVVVDAITRIRDTATAFERVFVVEVMGHRSGYLALYTGIASGADAIIIPEEETFSLDPIAEDVKVAFSEKKKSHYLIIVAEGAGSAYILGKILEEKSGHEVRVIVLGHIQRGGSPTAFDRILASRFGSSAVEFLLEGKSGVMTGLNADKVEAVPYEVPLTQRKSIPERLMQLASVIA